MPLVKGIREMTEKYDAKFVPDVIRTRYTQIADIMNARFEAGSSPIANIIETVRDILTENGVPAGLWGKYIAFAEILVSKTFSHKGSVLEKFASGLKSYWVTAKNADPAILDKIIEAVIGTVPPY